MKRRILIFGTAAALYSILMAVVWDIGTRQAHEKTEWQLDYGVIDVHDTVAGAIDTMLGHVARTAVRHIGYAHHMPMDRMAAGAKELDIDSQLEMAADYCGDLFTEKKLLHSPAGAVFARDGFGEKDREILDAICYHTTGRGNMSALEKIVYLADKIEPARTYMDLEPIRKAAQTDLDEATRMTALAIKAKFDRQERPTHPSTVDMLRDLGI